MYLIKIFENYPERRDDRVVREENREAPEILSCVEPSEKTIKSILDFARSYDVVETESTGCVEIILN